MVLAVVVVIAGGANGNSRQDVGQCVDRRLALLDRMVDIGGSDGSCGDNDNHDNHSGNICLGWVDTLAAAEGEVGDVCLDETFTPVCVALAPPPAAAVVSPDRTGDRGLYEGLRASDPAAPAVGGDTLGAGGDGGEVPAPEDRGQLSPEATIAGCWPFPVAECETLWRIDGCESGHGNDPGTYDLDAENGGRLQLNKATWAAYFEREYGWTWATVVKDDAVNRMAAYVIWQRSGWSAWACY